MSTRMGVKMALLMAFAEQKAWNPVGNNYDTKPIYIPKRQKKKGYQKRRSKK